MHLLVLGVDVCYFFGLLKHSQLGTLLPLSHLAHLGLCRHSTKHAPHPCAQSDVVDDIQ